MDFEHFYETEFKTSDKDSNTSLYCPKLNTVSIIYAEENECDLHVWSAKILDASLYYI